MIKKIVLIALFLLPTGIIFSSPEAEVYVKEWDLGIIGRGDIIKREFKIRNLGSSLLQIEKIHIRCNCLSAEIVEDEAKKGDYIKFVILLDPAKLPDGEVQKYVYVRLNAPGLSTYRIRIKGYLTEGIEPMRHRIKSLGLPLVSIAGLVDGINPCAFVTIIFLISFLSFSHKGRGHILKSGFLYITGVFITYLILGIGLLKSIDALDNIRQASSLIQYIGIILLIIIGIINLIDTLVYSAGGSTSNIIMRMSLGSHRLIHRIIRANFKGRYFLVSIFFAGILISLIESACTGQTYIPCLLFINKISAIIRWKSIILLLVYNFMFILPLIVIGGIAVYGSGLDKLRRFGRRNIVISKSLMAILFILMAIILFMLKVG